MIFEKTFLVRKTMRSFLEQIVSNENRSTHFREAEIREDMDTDVRCGTRCHGARVQPQSQCAVLLCSFLPVL